MLKQFRHWSEVVDQLSTCSGRLFIWGAGSALDRVVHHLGITPTAIVDSDLTKVGRQVHGSAIISPTSFFELAAAEDVVAIASSHSPEIISAIRRNFPGARVIALLEPEVLIGLIEFACLRSTENAALHFELAEACLGAPAESLPVRARQAVAACRAGLALRPEDLNGWFTLANALRLLGATAEADDALAAGLARLLPEGPDSRSELLHPSSAAPAARPADLTVKDKIHVALGGGLGNRVMVLLSALRLADFYRRRLFVYSARFDEPVLKVDPFPLDVTDIFTAPYPFEFYEEAVEEFYGRVTTDNAYFYNDGRLVRPSRVSEPKLGEPLLVPAAAGFYANHLEPRIASNECRDPIMYDIGKYFNQLTLAEPVARRVAELSSQIDLDNALGVHIRRPLRNSVISGWEQDLWGSFPVDAYLDLVATILERYPSLTSLYVATNDEDLREAILARFGPRAVANRAAGEGWHTVDALRESFVEMVMLSRCRVILRPEGSSFSFLASVLNLRPMIIVTGVKPPGILQLKGWRW